MNEIHIAGVVRATWRYDGNLFARLSVSRERPRPTRHSERGGNVDYISVVFPGGAEQGLRIERGQTLTVHGWLQSREIEEELESFLRRSQRRRGENDSAALSDVAATAPVQRTVTEVVAERWAVSNYEPLATGR
jgi:hypothetical protein